MTCGHEWEKEQETSEQVAKDACGNVLGLSDGQGSQTERDFQNAEERDEVKTDTARR
jgi:hypothetical protein